MIDLAPVVITASEAQAQANADLCGLLAIVFFVLWFFK